MEPGPKSVSDLQKTIQETAVTDDKKATADDVAQHIERYQADPEAHQESLSERLQSAMLEFGADHPDLAEAMRQAVYDLSNAGV